MTASFFLRFIRKQVAARSHKSWTGHVVSEFITIFYENVYGITYFIKKTVKLNSIPVFFRHIEKYFKKSPLISETVIQYSCSESHGKFHISSLVQILVSRTIHYHWKYTSLFFWIFFPHSIVGEYGDYVESDMILSAKEFLLLIMNINERWAMYCKNIYFRTFRKL